MVAAFALAVVAAFMDNDGGSAWWPPVLATAFAGTFVAYITDAYRTGTVSLKFTKTNRFQQPTMFGVIVAIYVVAAVMCCILAVGFWVDLWRSMGR
jgi:hypothetical protein